MTENYVAWTKLGINAEFHSVLQSPHSLDELEEFARSKFATIPHRDLQVPRDQPNYKQKAG